MELLDSHFSKLSGNLFFDPANESYEMFSNKGIANHLNYLTFKKLFEEMQSRKNLIILESGIASAGTNSTYLFNDYIKKIWGKILVS
jgi:hypothetical protein